jgi:hypothetical protein
MQEGRASKAYKHFVEAYCVFNDIFEGLISLEDVFNMPYPMFNDILMKQIQRKKKQKDEFEKKQGKYRGGVSTPKVGQQVKK